MKMLRLSLMKFISLFSQAAVLSFALSTISVAATDVMFTSALWVAEDKGVLKVTTSDGNILFEIKDIGKVKAVATDGQHGRLWVATSSIITAYNFAGDQLLKTSLPFKFKVHKMNDVMMTVDEEEGSIWLLDKKKLIKLDAEGNVVIQKSFPHKIESISFDNHNRRLWLIHKGTMAPDSEHKKGSHQTTVSSINSVTGEWISSFSPSPKDKLHLGIIHYDESLNELWFLEKDFLVRYDLDGNLTFTGTIKPLKNFKLDGKGNIWASKKETLYYISDSDSVLFQVKPFPEKHNKISYIVVNPTDQSVWVASHNNIVNYSNEGLEKHRLTIKKKINGLAIYSDVYKPTISLISPASDSLINNSTPSFVFNLKDKGVGANPNSIELKSNDQVLPTKCLLDGITKNVTCAVIDAFDDGVWDITATVKDYIGNTSKSIQFTLSVDTVAPSITIDSHRNGAYVNQSAQNITGSLSEFAVLSLNTFPVALELNNNFSYPVLLFEGQNNFLLEAEDEANNKGTLPFILFLDTVAPAKADTAKIEVSDILDNQASLTGLANSVEGFAIIEVTNLTTNSVTSIQANEDGSFSLNVIANAGDKLKLVVIDKAGNRSVLSEVKVPLPLTIEVTSPLDSAVIQGDNVNIEGVFKGPINVGITINGHAAEVSPNGSFILNGLALNTGDNVIDVVLTTLAGDTVTKEITVTSHGLTQPFKFEPNFNSGPAPFNVDLEFAWYGNEVISQIDIDYEGDGVIDYTTNSEQESFTTLFTEPGIYRPSITVTTGSAIYQKQTVILVQSRESMIQLFTALWDGMNTALVLGDVSTALTYLNDFGQRQYGPVFEVLKDKMPQIVQSYSIPKGVLITGNVGELAVNRDYKGQNRIYFIYFMRGQDGVWKLHNM